MNTLEQFVATHLLEYEEMFYNFYIPDSIILLHLERARKEPSRFSRRTERIKRAIITEDLDQDIFDSYCHVSISPEFVRDYRTRINERCFENYLRGYPERKTICAFEEILGPMNVQQKTMLILNVNSYIFHFDLEYTRSIYESIKPLDLPKNHPLATQKKEEEEDTIPINQGDMIRYVNPIKRALQSLTLSEFLQHRQDEIKRSDDPIIRDRWLLSIAEIDKYYQIYRFEGFLEDQLDLSNISVLFWERLIDFDVFPIRVYQKYWPFMSEETKRYLAKCGKFTKQLEYEREYQKGIEVLYRIYQSVCDPFIIGVLDVLMKNYYI